MVRNFRRRNRKRLKATLVLSNQSMNARKQENVIIALYRFLSLILLHFFSLSSAGENTERPYRWWLLAHTWIHIAQHSLPSARMFDFAYSMYHLKFSSHPDTFFSLVVSAMPLHILLYFSISSSAITYRLDTYDAPHVRYSIHWCEKILFFQPSPITMGMREIKQL